MMGISYISSISCTCHIISTYDIFDAIDHARNVSVEIEFVGTARRHTCVCKHLVLEFINDSRRSKDAVLLATG